MLYRPIDASYSKCVCTCADLVASFLLCSTRKKYDWDGESEAGRRREVEREREKRVVFTDLILTTTPGRAFPWNRFAIAPLFIQVVGESSKIYRACAFCNTSLWILNTFGMSNYTHTRGRSRAHTQTLNPWSKAWKCEFRFSCDICEERVIP